jgi:hypothetical protein
MFFEQTRPGLADRRPNPLLWFSGMNRVKQYLAYSFPKRAVLLVLAAIIVLSAYLLGGVGITAYAASSSLPGERLYPIKTTLENLQASLTSDSAKQARLYLDFARRRLVEMQALIAKGRYSDIQQAAGEYENDIQKALIALEQLSRTDRAEAITLNTEAANSLRVYHRILTQMLLLIPQDQQSALQNAIKITQPARDDDDDDIPGSEPMPTPTTISTPTSAPADLAPQPTAAVPTSTPAPKDPGKDDSKDQKEDDNKDDGNESGAGNGGAGQGDDDGGGDDNGGDDGGGDDDGGDG